MADPMRPQHFITRQNGIMVPLVALDELPSTVNIRGVPRNLSPHDVAGMTGLGTVESQHRKYVVDSPKAGLPPYQKVDLLSSKWATGAKEGFQPEQKVVRNDLLSSKWATAAPNQDLETRFKGLQFSRQAPASAMTPRPQPKAYGIEETTLPTQLGNRPTRPAKAARPTLTVEDLALNPAPGVKEYCSYWIRHGECDYAQQGCLYRHEMPLDPPTLERLGLRDIPRWYREQHGLGSYLALSAQRAATGNGTPRSPGMLDRKWRDKHPGAKVPATTTTTTTTTSTPAAANPSPKPRTNNNTPPHNPVGAWNTFAQTHTPAYHSHVRGPLHSPPMPASTTAPSPAVTGRPAFPTAPTATHHAKTSSSRPGTCLIPADTESLSARIVREANEQLDLHEERERAALMKYKPLVPEKTGSPNGSESSSGSGNGSADLTPLGSDVEIEAEAEAEAELGLEADADGEAEVAGLEGNSTTAESVEVITTPPTSRGRKANVPSAARIRGKREVATAAAATSISAAKKQGKRARARGRKPAPMARRPGVGVGIDVVVVDVDRDAQRKAVERARARVERMG